MKNSKMVLLAAVLLSGTGTVLRAQESEAAGTKTIKKGRLSKETDLLARISYENVKHLRYPKPQKTPDWASTSNTRPSDVPGAAAPPLTSMATSFSRCFRSGAASA